MERQGAYAFVPSPEHAQAGHPESPTRLKELSPDRPLDLPVEMSRVEPAILAADNLELVHHPDYVTHLQEIMEEGPGVLDHGDTYFNPKSFSAACDAAGAAVAVARAVVDGDSRIGISIARPPGHHATPDRALGFCLLNNIALAARAVQKRGLERVMIIDFDVHHGNGTQEIFYEDGSVLYVSFHQRGIFPGTGRIKERGRGESLGTTFNVPLPADTGHDGYLRLADEILPRLADMFNPDILLFSAGFDAHWKDPLAGLRLSSRTYSQLGELFHSISAEHCQGRAVCVLEGGYSPTVLARSLHAVVRGLLGLEPPPDPSPAPEQTEPELSGLLERLLQHLD